jgi:hypothetical protein
MDPYKKTFKKIVVTNEILGVEETVLQTLGRYAKTKEVKGRNLTTDRFFVFFHDSW